MPMSTEWQLAREAAKRYQQILVPAILGPFARALVEWSAPRLGEVVLDAGCGTGEAARLAAALVGSEGRVVGIDINAGMLEVARSLPPVSGAPGTQAPIDWRQESVYQLPILNQSIDLVLCAQTMQFLSDRKQALAEMYRVLKPGGRLAISLWLPIVENPYFYSLVETVTIHAGAESAAGLKAAFNLTDPLEIGLLLQEGGFREIAYAAKELNLSLPPMPEFVPRHISATPMHTGFESAPPAARQAVVADMTARMSPYTHGSTTRVPFRSHLIMASR